MGYAQRDNGPCDSRHSRAYCPVLYLAPARLLSGSRPQRGALCPDGPRSPTAWTPYACRGRSHTCIAHAPAAGAPRPQRESFGTAFSVFPVFSCHSLPLALRCVGPARRGAVLYGSASNLSPVVGPARRGTACGTTSGGALEPGCRRTAHCRQRRFAASTAVSLILLRAESRRMGETAVDVAKVRSRSPRSSDARPRSAEVSTCPVELVRTPRSRAPEYDGGIPGGGSIWCHALPSARVRRSSPRRASTISRRYVQNFQNFTVF